ncbi:serine--tRNA ligase [Candidatus Woesearchaeota archaeon]|nr:serine--tRNA ligase [Candidatus Woesearchaeota archaeon]
MLDIKLIREKPDEVKANLKKRNKPEYIKMVDDVLKLDEQVRKLKGETDELRARRNKVSEEINVARKAGKDVKTLLEEAKQIPAHIANNETKLAELEQSFRDIMLRIPNLLHESVPIGKDETESKVVKVFGKQTKHDFEPLSHIDLVTLGGLADLDRAAKISGARWYFLKGKLARLQLAIMEYGVDFMTKKGHTMIVPPHFINRKAYEGVTDMGAFEEALYKVEGEDLYAIATSEHPLVSEFMDETLEAKDFPIKLFGISPCYRKEAGAHGRDQKGIFRVHQFNKIEQIIVCKPEDSWKLHEELTANAIEFWKTLGIPFRQVTLCSGDTGVAMSKTYDYEAWMPVQNAWREMGSSSNAADYQSRRLNIRYQDKGERGFVHTLNATLITDTRPIVAILENNQDKDGTIHIPEPLQKYCGFKTIEIKK